MNQIEIKYRNKLLICYLCLGILVLLFFRLINYTGKEGFNPSDDGVLLAQSFRIINGEIPHKDFISIRPVMSGVLHCIHFFSPLPLFDSARWFVVFQFFIIALAFMAIVRKLSYDRIPLPLDLALFLIVFSTGILNYNLFPWTTLDAVFWSVLSIRMFLCSRNSDFKNGMAVFLLVLASLSRQNFILPALLLTAYIIYEYLWNWKLMKGLFIALLAWIPLFGYLLMLIITNSLPEFISQMTGRTELFETGVLQYIKMWVRSPISLLHLGIYLLFVLFISGHRNSKAITWLQNKYHWIIKALLGWVFAMIVLHFIRSEINIFMLPFELFWVLIDLCLIAWMVKKPETQTIIAVLFILFIAYTSSISLGDNSPIFACGILTGTILFASSRLLISNIGKTKFVWQYTFLFLSILIFGLGIFSQMRINYRDLSAWKLTYELKQANSEFGSVITNPETGKYYKELSDVFQNLPQSKNHTIVLPNNSAFYPLFSTQNPLPLDWMQPAEYIGNECRINTKVNNLCKEPGYYFIVDKYDIKKLFKQKTLLDQLEYKYISIITLRCKKLKINSNYFDVYSSY